MFFFIDLGSFGAGFKMCDIIQSASENNHGLANSFFIDLDSFGAGFKMCDIIQSARENNHSLGNCSFVFSLNLAHLEQVSKCVTSFSQIVKIIIA